MTIITTPSDAMLNAIGSRHRGASPLPLAARAAAVWAAYRARARAARNLRLLRGLDDHVLRDIGLTRGDLYGLK